METLQPKLRFPEFKGNWEKKNLGEIFTIFNGFAFSSSDSVDDGVLWVKIADVGLQEMKKDNLSFLPSEYLHKHKKFVLNKDDYVIALTRPILNGKLKIAKIDKFFSGSLLNQRVGKLLTLNNSTFVFNILQKDLLIKSIENNISGSDPPNLSPNEISFIESYIPQLEEQTRIANFLSAIDEKLHLLKEKKALLEEYKKGMMQKIFKQELRFKDDSGEDFGDWEEKILGEVGSVLNGLTYSPDDVSADGVLVLRSSNIKHGRLKFEDNVYVNKDNFTPVIENDILICVRNGSRNLIGKNTIITKEIIGVAFGAFMTVYRSEFNNFLIHWFGSEDFFENVNLNLGATINSINGSDLKKFKIPFPSQKEQTKIAQFLSAIDEKIGLVGNQIEETVEYKKGLLQGMFV